MRIFWKKAVKIAAASGAPKPDLLLASGGWGIYPQTSTLLLLPAVKTLSECVSTSAKRVLLLLKKNKCNNSIYSAFASSALLRFNNSDCNFVGGSAKICFAPAAGYLSTPMLLVSVKQNKLQKI